MNKPSEVETKEMILRCHLVPAFGSMLLDAIGYAQIQDYASGKVDKGLSKKTVNNQESNPCEGSEQEARRDADLPTKPTKSFGQVAVVRSRAIPHDPV